MSREQKRRELLQRLDGKLPPHERSDFNLDRWLDSFDMDVDRCCEVIGEYVKNRRALGLDRPDAFDGFFSRKDVQHYFGVFPQSRIRCDWVNGYDNGLVYVETGVADATKVIRSGEFLYTFFSYCEYYLQLILEHERNTGKRSYAVCIFDMADMSILQYANPMAPINRIFEARVGIWMNYYAEMLSRVVIVNPPRLLSILLKIMSILLPAKVLGRFFIAQSLEDIAKWITPDAIPIGFNGKKVVEGAERPTGCNAPKVLNKEDYLRDGMVWERHGVAKVPYEQVVVGAGESYTREMDAQEGQWLLYEWFANRNFEVRLETANGDYLLPRFRMCTPLLAEEGALRVGEHTRLVLELKNLSKWQKMKLRVAVQLVDD